MISYLKEQVDKILTYLFKVERRTLLWENPNPDTAFTAQNINVDLSDYDEIEVVAKHWSNNGTIASARCKTTELGCILVPNGASAHMAFRDWQGHTGYIYMAQGRDLYGTSLSYSDYAGIPLRIYGIKLGGVQRNPVVAVLSAISKIGGGVSECNRKRTVFQTFEKSKSSLVSGAGNTDVLCSVHLGYTGRSDGLRSAVSILSDVGNNKHLGIQELGVFCTIRAVGDSVCKLANKCRRRFTKFHNASGGIHYRALTISERRCAA